MPTGARTRKPTAPVRCRTFWRARAARLGIWIIAGSVPLAPASGERSAQACLVYDAKGARVARYDKIHLFDVELPDRAESYRESAHMAPGETRW